MKRRCFLLAVAAAMFMPMGLSAQNQVIRVFNGGTVLLQKNVGEMDSIKSVGGYLMFYFGNESRSFLNGTVDSVTFAYVDVDSVDTDTTVVDTNSRVHIVWENNSVTVDNPYSGNGLSISVNGQHVTAVASGSVANIVYWLQGSSANGSFTLTTDKKYIVLFDGLDLSNPGGAAIDILSDHKGVFHLADGGVNTLTDGVASLGRGAIQSRGKIVFQGSGALNVTGLSKHGIQTSGSTTVLDGNINVLGAVKDGMNVDNFIMSGGNVTVTSSGDGIDGDQGYIDISGGTLSIVCTTDDVKGLCCDSTLTISGGTVNVTVSGNQSKAIKTKQSLAISDGTVEVHANGSVVMETSGNGYDPSYCTGFKVGGNMTVSGGNITVVCPSTNSGGKAISCDGDLYVSGGNMVLSSTGACVKYTDSTGTYDSYSSTCIKAEGDVNISGGTIQATAGGRAISAEGNYLQTGGTVTTSTSASGFTTIGSGSSCSDGFAAACLKVDGNVVFTAGSFHGSSTGSGGRGIVCDGTFTMGTENGVDSLLHIYAQTSGSYVNVASGGGPGGGFGEAEYWKGLPKAIKIEDTIRIYSGYLQSYCAQTSGSTTGEAIESKSALFVNGGYVEANAYDDAINAGTYLAINGGHVWAYSRGNDAIDCNGTSLYINGGVVVARGSETGVDDNSDRNGHMYVTGGTVVAIGGNMGSIEGTPTVTNQKYLSIGSGGGGPGGGGPGGSGGQSTTATNGFCVKNSSGTEIILTYKWPSFSGNGFSNGAEGTGVQMLGFSDVQMLGCSDVTDVRKDGSSETGDGDSKRVNGIFVTSPNIQSGSYKYFTSPTISGGTHWHGLYTGATVTTSGNGTSVTAQ